MTPKEALEILKKYPNDEESIKYNADSIEALYMAIKALEDATDTDVDTISRQAAIDAVHKEFDECLVWDESGERTANEIENILDCLPSVKPKRKIGKWVWLSSTSDRTPCEMKFACSRCCHETIVHANALTKPWERYCPNCGADMRGEEDE